MSVSFKYWDDCVDPEDMRSLWADAAVKKEWFDANERMGHKVHFYRNPDGHEYLTQIEMRAVAGIIVERHFTSQLDPDMICALAEILSDKQLLAEQYNKKTKETKMGIMQMSPTTADWLVRAMGYKNYDIEGNPNMLYGPFVNVYFGAAYIKWLSNHDGSVLEMTKTDFTPDALTIDVPASMKAGDGFTYWDSRVSQVDMEDMWRDPDVLNEWIKSGERRGRVRFSLDAEKRPYLSRVEVKAVAQIISQRYYKRGPVKPKALAALAEVCSMRFVNGVRVRTGLMGIDYPTAEWLYRVIGREEYKVKSVDDLYNPLVSMYFGASYLAWLSEYEGRERSLEFMIQAYLGGPENVNLQETGRLWKNFQEALSHYEDPKREQGSCCIL